MFSARKAALAAIAGASLLAAVPALANTSTVHVTLSDKDGGMSMPEGLGHGMHGDMAMASMKIGLSTDTVHAGHVVFDATNGSTEAVHELILAPLTGADEKLPYMADQSRVNEDKAGYLGEVEELDPGKSGELAVDLKPGAYILYCNIPGHYMAGMWAVLTVTD